MATADQVKALVHSHGEGDDRRFYSVALQVAAKAARNGQTNFAQELRNLVDVQRTEHAGATRAPGKPVPVARPRGELAELLTVTYPDTRLADLALAEDVRQRLDRVVLEQRQQDVLRAHGFQPLRRLLLTGAPGTGKTMTGRALAGELHLPLFTIRLDGLITKMMGETAAKLRLIFDAAADMRGVYLFDEVDALAGERAHGNDVGEIRRVLNSFLQFLEQHESESLLIAASNHPQLLDRALFRRFDLAVAYPLPTPQVVRTVISNRLTSMIPARWPWKTVEESARGLSQAEISLASEFAAKAAILAGETSVTTSAIVAALRDRHRASDGND